MSHTIGQTKQNKQQSKKLSQVMPDSLKPEEQPRPPMLTLSDADYEFLFNQLLEGISHGWHDRRIVKFFVSLGDRSNQKDWVAWLERLKVKASALPSQSKRQLGVMMIRLGELTRSTTEVDKIGAASHRIGKELLFGNVESVWEYVGPDLLSSKDDDATDNFTDRSRQELSERLPNDFKASSSNEVELETAEASIELETESKKARSSSSSTEDFSLFSVTESSQLENTARESLETEYYDRNLSEAEISASLPSTAASFDSNHSNEQKSNQTELPTSKSALPDKLTADLTDFPENVSQAKQTTPNRSDSELESSFSETNPNTIETKTGRDKPQNTADSMPTESEIEAFDVSEVMNLIQEDEELARQISQKLNSTIALSQDTVTLDDSSLELIESWFNLGLKQASLGEFAKAIASWENALRIDPNLSEAWHNRGSALGRLGNYQAAIESFQNALAIDPENYQAWNDRAHALYQLQYWSLAADSWSKAIKIMPGNHLFWYNRGCALEQLQKWDEAIASHEKALLIVPNFQPARSRYINLVADISRPN